MGDCQSNVDLRQISFSFPFYIDRMVQRKGGNTFRRVQENRGCVFFDGVPAGGLEVQAIVFSGAPGFVAYGAIFDTIVAWASPIVARQQREDFKHKYGFALLGKRSIDLISDQFDDPCAIQQFVVPEELMDQRERLVQALNEVLQGTRPPEAM